MRISSIWQQTRYFYKKRMGKQFSFTFGKKIYFQYLEKEILRILLYKEEKGGWGKINK